MFVPDYKEKKGLKILLVEDESIPMLVHQMMLTELGHTPDKAEDGQKALDLACKNYDLILMDIGLPDINGFEVTLRIRQMEYKQERARAYIVALTAYSLVEIREECLVAEMDEVILKPVAAQRLQELLDKVIALKGNKHL